MKMDGKFLLSIATLLGVIVGAGIFTLPYGLSRAGILSFLFFSFLLGGATLLIHLFLGEVILRTKGKHRLVGYAKIYLGRFGEFLITIATVLGSIGTLLAYVLMGGEFLKILFSPFLETSSFFWSLIFWAILSYFVWRGIRLIAKAELFTNFGFFLIIFFILLFGLAKFKLENFSFFNREQIFLPYGLILFAFAGASGVLEISEILKSPKERKGLPKVIIFTQILVFLLYLLFALGIAGISGSQTSREALSGLVPFLGQKIIFFGALAGAITLADSFLVIGLYLRNTLIFDYKFSKILAVLLSCGVPLFLFLAGFKDFIAAISLVGAVIGAIEGTAILLIYERAKKLGDREPEYQIKAPSLLIHLLMLIFIIGALAKILY